MSGSRFLRASCLFASLAIVGLAAACSSSGAGPTEAGSDATTPSEGGTMSDGGTTPDQGTPADTGVDSAADSQATVDSSSADGTSNDSAAGDSSGGTDAGDAAAVVYPVRPPQILDAGGPVLASPKIVPVFFANDDGTVVPQLTTFTQELGTSDYFSTTMSEYGVGAGLSVPAVNLIETETMPIDDSAIQPWLAGKLNGNDPAWPAPDANTVYVLYYPPNVTVTIGGLTGCQGFSAYHNEVSLDAAHGSRNVAYVVVPRCPSVGALTGIDAVTAPASARIAEAVTDPYPSMNPAYTSVDDAHFDWETVVGGGEVGAMCSLASSLYLKPSGFAYTVQRLWSNASIKAGHDPCLPELPGEVYFNSEPLLSGTVPVKTRNVLGLQIAAGGSATIPLALYSEGGPLGPWTVSATDLQQVLGNGAELTFSFDKTQGQAGDTIQMTIHDPAALTGGHDTFIVLSTLGQQKTYWMGEVTN
jgi:hypothetical protein